MYDIKVWLTRMDGHMGLANSVALKSAGVTKSLEDPDGGTIVRNSAGGNVTSIIVESVVPSLSDIGSS